MDQLDYIIKNAKKADKLLRQAAFPYQRKNFTYFDNLKFTAVFEPDSTYMAMCKEDEIIVNTSKFSCWNKEKCDKELVEVLMHELIHNYIGHWFHDRDFITGFSGDNSHIFVLFVTWFNKHLKGYNIGLNSYTAEANMKRIYKELYDKLDVISFTDLFIKCIEIIEKFNLIIKEFNQDLLNRKEKIVVGCMFNFSDNDGDYTGAYNYNDEQLFIYISIKYYHSAKELREDLEEMIDSLFYCIEDRFIFDKTNCSDDYYFKCIN